MQTEMPTNEALQNDENTQEKSESQELDLETYGEKKFETGGSKPIFPKVTKATIISAVMMQGSKVREQTGSENQYKDLWLNVSLEYKDIDDEIKKTWENYGGGRLYIENDNFWVGKDSALGKVYSLVNDTFDFDETLNSFVNLLVGKIVGLKTEFTTVAGKEYKKTMITQFYN